MPVLFHIREGARFSKRTGEPAALIMIADVTGLSGDQGRMLTNAYAHPRMPRGGAPHPSVANYVAASHDAEVIGAGTVRFQITFTETISGSGVNISVKRKEDTKPGLIQIGAGIATEKTERDKDGKPITVSFTESGIKRTQGVEVEVAVPQPVRRIERTETNPDLQLADEYVGAVNSSPIWGRSSRTLLCRQIQFTSRDGGQTWTGVYEFQYRADKWDAVVAYRDPNTGDPKVGITTDNGIETKRVLREENFLGIGIDFPRR